MTSKKRRKRQCAQWPLRSTGLTLVPGSWTLDLKVVLATPNLGTYILRLQGKQHERANVFELRDNARNVWKIGGDGTRGEIYGHEALPFERLPGKDKQRVEKPIWLRVFIHVDKLAIFVKRSRTPRENGERKDDKRHKHEAEEGVVVRGKGRRAAGKRLQRGIISGQIVLVVIGACKNVSVQNVDVLHVSK